MAYNKEEIISKALTAIEDEECVTIEEVLLFLPCGKTWFYAEGLNEVNEIKEAIEAQKTKIKKKLRRNWRNSDNATLQIAEFKLISTDEERDKLNQQKVTTDNTHSFKDKPSINLIVGEGYKTNESGNENG